MTVTIEKVPAGLHYRSRTDYPQGGAATSEFTAALNGVPALVLGSNGFLAPVSLQSGDAATIEATYTLGLKPVAWSRWSLSADGSRLTIQTSYLKSGDKRMNVARFRRTH